MLRMPVVLDVVTDNVRQRRRTHRTVRRVTTALVVSGLVEVVALNAGITDNVLWPPTTRVRALALAALLLPWVPVIQDVVERVGLQSSRKRSRATEMR